MKDAFTKCMAVVVMCLATAAAHAQSTMEQIRQRKTIVVGVKADSRPWGFIDEHGHSVGWEIDLAKEMARRLGVTAELVVVTSANRIQLLEQGRVDLIVATMSDTEARRKVVTMIEPHYFSEGTGVLVGKNSGIQKWEDLTGRKLCGVNGSIYNRSLQQKYGAEVIAFAGLTEAQAALKAGSCAGLAYGDTILSLLLAENENLQGTFHMPLQSIDEVPWAMAVRLQDRNSELQKFVERHLIEMHRSGFLLKTLKTWGVIRPPAMLVELNRKYSSQVQ